MNSLFRSTLPATALLAQLMLGTAISHAQTGLLFDGDFESGTFQGWTPGGENGGFASVAAKGSCYSGNDTTAISFNGNPTSNYAALLRSNPAGETGSVAALRSQQFEAGNGVIFSALTETLSDDPRDHPVDLVVKIINSNGEVISEQPYRTAIIQLAQGCPSEQRDTAFSGHFIDTHHLAGEQISIEFNQNTRNQGLGYFTLIDDVVFIDSSSFLLSTSQPRAVAGTGVTTSGTFFLDPRSSTDPDNAPIELNYSWFINGDTNVRELDIPCVNLNTDFQLSAGNNIATLYVNDGFSYAADTIRFVIPETATTSTNGNDENDGADGTDGTDGTDGNNNGNNNQTTATLTDPLNECDVDLRAIFIPETDQDSDDGGDIGDDNNDNGDNGGTPVTGGDSNSAPVLQITSNNAFTIGEQAVNLVTEATITDADSDDSIVSATITITNPADGDSFALANRPASIQASISNNGASGVSIVITSSETDSASDFVTSIESITFSYATPTGETPETGNRTITYSVSDGTTNSAPVSSIITVSGP